MVSRSSAECEYRALASVIADIRPFYFSLRELGVALLLCDNMSALSLSNKPELHARSRHIEIDFHLIRELVVHGAN